MELKHEVKKQGIARLDGNLDEYLTTWLKTNYAKTLGFHSKSHFVTNAVRELLFRYAVPNQTDLLRYKTYYELFDNSIQKKVEVHINKKDLHLECHNCNSVKCDHVLHIWNTPNENTHLKQLKLLNPFEHLFLNI